MRWVLTESLEAAARLPPKPRRQAFSEIADRGNLELTVA